MGLADLIHRKKTATVSSPAKAILAIPAPFQADIPPTIATIATIAIAENKPAEIEDQPSAEKTQRQPDIVSAFCEPYEGHCSVKVTGVYPDECIEMKCEHYPSGHIRQRWYATLMPSLNVPAERVCRCCKGTDFWHSAVQANVTVCRKCHPPMEGAEQMHIKQCHASAESGRGVNANLPITP